MKKNLLMIFAIITLTNLSAQSHQGSGVNGTTLNGATGLIVVPDAQIGWDRAKLGIDLGYNLVLSRNNAMKHLPRYSFNLFHFLELSGLMQIDREHEAIDSSVIGTKLQFFRGDNTALALGANMEIPVSSRYNGINLKAFFSATYSGDLFSMPTSTTVTFGWQILESDTLSSQLIYGMGFAMAIFPEVFHNYLIWITDFSNFSYALYNSAVDADYRGSFNTGIRFNPIKKGRFNLLIDILGTDLFETTRGFSIGISSGFAIVPMESRAPVNTITNGQDSL
ncbi:MAG: hypothetical protein B0D92_00065 [Spirochaeta sp. LUC14_002_19_P3]|nr:MAG: hypothetical protein B0D92_00065 [Spirochaeta sp. LUC14_002_19_P3]